MVGERRVVTMLFCDVKGSTAAAEQLDPEDWSEIINGAFEYMIRPVYRYEGMVARLMGDAILAFFGAPIAHEDDPQRAILAGLEIISGIQPYRAQVMERFGMDFNLRVGINTGLVVVGAVGSDLRMEYTALGDAINLASRMEQTAEPGTVQIAHDTYKLTKSIFDFERLGPVDVKGKLEPVQAYRVLGRKAQTTRQRGIEGLQAEIVGRAAELQTLTELIANLNQGVGWMVCLLGDAGLGKSRLINEISRIFQNRIGASGNWYDTNSLSYETNQAYGLIQRMLRTVTHIEYDDTPALIREKLSDLSAYLPEEKRSRASQVFETLFGLEQDNGAYPLEGEIFKQELFEAVQGWWRNSFNERSTVLIFDDMHWSDTASTELLIRLLPLTAEIPLVLLFAMREERQAPAWQIKIISDDQYRHRSTEITLHPLSRAESNELLNRLLAIAELPDSMRESILEKSGGNPFFIEEVVRTLIDNGALVAEDRDVNGQTQRFWRATTSGSDFEIPDNLQSLLASRMDRLEDATRSTLQMASVIGRTFYRRVLQAVDEASQELDQRVGVLLRMDMIREAARVPEVEYAFRNPLTQEAVYRTILFKRRREFHRRVAEAMEELYPERLERLYGLLAHHFALAGMRDKAIDYTRQASHQAVNLYAYDDALQSLRTALELIEPGKMEETHLVLLEELGDVYRLLRDGGRAIDFYQQAIELIPGQPFDDPILAVRLHRKIVQVVTDLKWSVSLENLHHAHEMRLVSKTKLIEGINAHKDKPAHPEIVRAQVALSVDAWRIQDPPDWQAAQQFAESAVDITGQLDSPVDRSQALGALANVLDGRSMLRDHWQVIQERMAIRPQLKPNDFLENIDSLRSAGAAAMYIGEYSQAIRILREAEELAIQAQVIDQQANTLGLQAQCLFRLDRWDEVLRLEEKWRDLEQRYSRERVGETCFYVALSSSIYALRGEEKQAAVYREESYNYMVSVSGPSEDWQRNQFY